MNYDEIEQIILCEICQWLGVASIDKNKSWKKLGWHNDSLDESDFIMSIEERIGIKFNADSQFLISHFYDTKRTVNDFIVGLWKIHKCDKEVV